MDNPLLKYFVPEAPIKVIGPNAAGTHTRVEVLVTPFGSKSKKDLHGEWFDTNTVFGDDDVKTKFALYEHFMNDWNNPVMSELGKQKQIMGPATLVKKDAVGRWFEMEIKRSLEYHDALMNMIDLKMMGASTQCFPNSKNRNTEGYIDLWVESEVSLTPTPANKDTIGRVYEVIGAKSVDFKLPKLQYVKDGQLHDLEAGTDIAAPTPAPTTDIAQEIEQILGTPETTEALDPVIDFNEDMQKAMRTLIAQEVKAQMAAVMALWGDTPETAKANVQTMQTNSQSIVDSLRNLGDRMSKLETGLLTFAKFFKDLSAKNLGAGQSAREKEVMDASKQTPAPSVLNRPKSAVPAHLREASGIVTK